MRTLERRLGALCRAVAVKVAQHMMKNKKVNKGKDEELNTDMVSDIPKAAEPDLTTQLAHPPEMPIVIDESALEDILGVMLFS